MVFVSESKDLETPIANISVDSIIGSERLMLLLIILLALTFAILISGRLCAASTASRIYGSLLAALLLSVSVTLAFGFRQLVGFDHVTLWHLVGVTFGALCHTFPLVFMITYVAMIYGRKRGRARASHAGFVPFVFSTILVFVAMALLIAGFTSTKIEPNWIEVTHTNLTTPKWKKDAPPLRVVQLSDLHIKKFGYRESNALKLVRRLKPDLILLTGDYTNYASSCLDVRRFMKELHARYGVYAVHGNWNPSYGPNGVFLGSDVQIIENETRALRTKSGKVVLGGVAWYSHEYGRTLFNGRMSPDAYTIVLSHMPENALYVGRGVDLALAGHTHGGQVRIPGIGPVITSTSMPRSQAAGLTKLPTGTLLYVNRGIGMEGGSSPQIRFLCRPEISVFTIRGAGE